MMSLGRRQCGMSDTSMTAKFPTISINQAGQAMLVWEQYNGEYWHIASRYKDLNGLWSDEVAISSIDSDAFDPQVMVDIYGNALATWTFYDDTTIKRIQISRYDAKILNGLIRIYRCCCQILTWIANLLRSCLIPRGILL
jgi:hypothetical protein